MMRVDIAGESVRARDLAEEDNIREISDILMDRLGVEWLEIRPRHIVRPVDLSEYRGSNTGINANKSMGTGECVNMRRTMILDRHRSTVIGNFNRYP